MHENAVFFFSCHHGVACPKLSEVISQYSSSSVVKDVGVRHGGPRFELW